ncbi:hypothetical protein [Desulfovibrio sp. Fe33]|uniref:hypothetical protein n=1 Tax=Desulfovibrio sp. Fe33 TaxID=3020842 RepID=UPI00234D0184|nr:hypothetical protein [Desulfovibrio sp. Fe33]
MNVSMDMSTMWPNSSARLVGQSRNISPVGEQPATEDTDETSGSPLSFKKELPPEEQRRVIFLQNLLAQTMAMAEGSPTDEQKERIRDIEKEIEKITGVKTKSHLSSMTDKMPGKTDKKEEEEREKSYQSMGIDPKETTHNNNTTPAKGDNPGMQMLRNNALLTAISTLGLGQSLSG